MGKKSTNENLVVGLDIGTTKIATVIGYRDENNQIEVLGWGRSKSTGVEFGEIFNVTKTRDGIQASCEIAANQANIDIESVYAGIAGHHIKTSRYRHVMYRHRMNTPISEQEIKELKEQVEKITINPGEQIIDVIPQSYLIDGRRTTTDPVGIMADMVIGTYQIVTGTDKEIQKIVNCGNNAGVEMKEIILEPVASSIACLTAEDKKGIALVDIGGGTTDLIIYIDGSPVYTKVIPLGGDIITKDIAKVCKISEENAEEIKIKHGTCVVDQANPKLLISVPKPNAPVVQINHQMLAKIINSRVQTDILEVLKTEIDNSGYRDQLINGLVLTGGGSQLRHIKELCNFVVGLSTRIGVPEVGFAKTIPTDLRNPMYSTVLGLLKYGILTEEERSENVKGKKNNRRKTNSDTKGDSGIFDKVRDYIERITNHIDTVN